MQSSAHVSTVIGLVGNKLDLEKETVVTAQDAEDLARQLST